MAAQCRHYIARKTVHTIYIAVLASTNRLFLAASSVCLSHGHHRGTPLQTFSLTKTSLGFKATFLMIPHSHKSNPHSHKSDPHSHKSSDAKRHQKGLSSAQKTWHDAAGLPEFNRNVLEVVPVSFGAVFWLGLFSRAIYRQFLKFWPNWWNTKVDNPYLSIL